MSPSSLCVDNSLLRSQERFTENVPFVPARPGASFIGMAAELQISDSSNNSVVLSGEIDTHTAPVLEERLEAIEAGGQMVLDLANVSFISSAGLTAMLTTQIRLQETGGSLTVENPTAAVERMIALSGLNGLLGLE
jgi:anti-sigma B factor antagonist